MSTPVTPLARHAFRRVVTLVAVLAVAACSDGSDGTSSDAVPKSESVQSFVGTVTCGGETGQAGPVVREVRVIFDRPVSLGMASSGSSARAVQVGGLAGSLVESQRSQMTLSLPYAGGLGQPLDFRVSVTPATGTYEERGRWVVGVDENGKATLQGDSTAALGPIANGWTATCRWNLAAAAAPAGPLAYGQIDQAFTPPASGLGASPGGPTPKAFGQCGADTFSVVTDGLYIGAAITGYYEGAKVATLVLSVGAVGTTASSQLAGALCPTAPMDSTNLQLAVMAAQIQQIDNYLGLATNAFYKAWYQLQLQNTATAAYLWNQNVNGISPQGTSKGLFGSFMDPDGVGLWNYALQPAANAPTDPKTLALNDAAYSNARIKATANADFYQNYLKELSGTDIVFPTSSTCTQNDCSAHVVQAPDSALIRLYRDLFQTLQADIDVYAQPSQTAGLPSPTNQNVVPLYDQYNTMLIKFWTQAVYALHEAMTMEWIVNQMNYFRATATPAASTYIGPIPSWGGIPGTHYVYGGKSLQEETDSYNATQRNLAKLHTARLNQLYLNTLNYIVSDVPVTPQAYPVTPISYTIGGVTYTENPVDYTGQVGRGIAASTAGSQGPTPLSLVPAVANGAWKSAAVLYQFVGLKDAAACLTNMQVYNQTVGTAGTLWDWLQQNPNACPSIFTLADGSALNQGVYDGNTLTPYTSMEKTTGATGKPLALAATITGNLKYCDPGRPAPYWDKRGPMLNCGQWYVPKFLAGGFPRANVPGANSAQNYWTVDNNYSIQAGLTMNGDCSNNLSFESGRYPAITTLIGDWTSGQPASCDAVVPTVPLEGTSSLQSPVKIGMRTLTGNYDSGNQTAGCSIGWIGSGIGNPLPDYDSNYNGGDEFQFGLRLPRGADGGNASGGWVLPLRVTAGCTNSSKKPYLLAHPRDTYSGYLGPDGTYVRDFSQDGYFCTQSSLAFTQTFFSCTLTDGSQYVFTLRNGNGNGTILDVRLSQP